MVNIGKFILTHERCLTWNEIYFANISIVGIILYFIIKNKLLKILLASSVVLMFLECLWPKPGRFGYQRSSAWRFI